MAKRKNREVNKKNKPHTDIYLQKMPKIRYVVRLRYNILTKNLSVTK
jgi:hypothetical protein